jgi:hypothetical protein
MAYYKFQSEWALTAAVDRVFELASHPEGYSGWWPAVKESQLLQEGNAEGVGARAAYTLRSPLLYSMRFVTTTVEAQRPSRIHTLERGDLVGTGTYILEGDEHRTHVRFVWSVSTTKTWMNLFAPLARPVFVLAHQRVMQAGAVAMARHLNATLLSPNTAVLSGRR